MRRGILAGVLFTVCLPVQAAIVRVAPSGAGDGSTWASAAPLPAALASSADGDEIWVAAGTYSGTFSLKSNVALYGGFAGTETSRGQRDPGANVSTLDGAGTTAAPVLSVAEYAGPRTVVDGLTIANGKAGGVKCAVGTEVTITRCIIRDNSTAASGAGLYVDEGFWDSDYVAPRFEANSFLNNSAAGMGGAVYLAARADIVQGVGYTLRNCVFVGNSAPKGAALYAVKGSAYNCTFAGNSGVTMLQTEASGGGTLSVAYLDVYNGIVANNTGQSFKVVPGDAFLVTFHNTCLWGNSVPEDPFTDPVGANGNIRRDPRFAGFPNDLRLLPESPCVDAGDDSVTTAGEVDRDGLPRIQGGHVDMGAYESTGYALPPPQPQTICVSPSGDDAKDGLTWATAKRTVQAGVDALAASGGEVWVAAGTYGKVRLGADQAVYGGFGGTETQRSQRDPAANVTILDGEGSGSVVYTLASASAGTVVDGFTIQNGAGDGVRTGTIYCHNVPLSVVQYRGGGVYIDGGSPTISHNTITSNTATFRFPSNPGTDCPTYDPSLGGGIYVGSGTPRLTGNTITGNTAFRGSGVYAAGTPTMKSNLISANHGVEASLFYTGSDPRDTGILYAGTAAGIIANNTLANSPLRLDAAADVANNIVTGGAFGVSVKTGMTPTLTSNDVWGNTTNYEGIADPSGTNGNISADPLFVSATDRHLQAASPCLDAGSDAYVFAAETDLDGAHRRQGAHVDIGCYEFPVPSPFVLVDVITALKIAAGAATGGQDAMARLNVNKDGALDVQDAVLIIRAMAGLGA